MLSIPYIWGNEDTKRLSNLPKFSYLVISGDEIWIYNF